MIHDLTHLLSDPSHWIGHVVMDGVLTLVLAYPARLLLNRHDRRTHGTHKRKK